MLKFIIIASLFCALTPSMGCDKPPDSSTPQPPPAPPPTPNPNPNSGTPLGTLTVSTIAGNGIADANGASLVSPINNPISVVTDTAGNIYVAEYNRIKKITASGTITVIAGNGARGFANGIGAEAIFNPVNGITIDKDGNLYAADRDNEMIRKIFTSGEVTTFAGSKTYGFLDAAGSAALFWEPVDVAADLLGNVYVADRSNARIRKISPAGIVSTFAGNGKSGYKDGPGETAEFFGIAGIAVDRSGNVYVADQENDVIRKITTLGDVSTLAGSRIRSYKNGKGINADFARPGDVAVDTIGNVYVADVDNNVIRKIEPDGTVTTFAGQAIRGFQDGPALTAQFYYPRGVHVDSKGNVYVADRANNRVRKISVQ